MKDIKNIQENFLKNIYKTSIISRDESFSKISDFLLNVANSKDSQICNLAFGELGTRLFDLVSELDYEHPEIKHGQFLSSADKDQLSNMSDYLNLCSLAKDNSLDHIINMFSNSITKSIFDVKSEIGLLKNRQNFVRLFRNTDTRSSLRKLKTTRAVGLTSLDKKLYELWQCDTDFSRFSRFDNFYLSEMKIAKEKIETYRSMGMESLALEIEASLASCENTTNDYYGFQRTTVTMAALSLAKLHGYYLDMSSGNATIKVPSHFYNFEGTTILTYIQYGKEHIGLPKKIDDYDYMPLAIPLHEMEISSKMKQVVNYLENFPEADGKPIFDHFLVISPGPTYPRKITETYTVCEKSGKKNIFSDLMSAKTFLEHTLIKEGYLTPVLLGEKDGRCYFICFWEC